MENTKITREKEWYFYLVYNGNYTYAGVSVDPKRRLRQHNGDIKGGAKYTTRKGPGWKHMCIIEGFDSSINCMRFEWAVKHCQPIRKGGIKMRLKKLKTVMNRDKWTSNTPETKFLPPLVIHWKNDDHKNIFDTFSI
jgi:structure-specific endonuclease subunit SLX1